MGKQTKDTTTNEYQKHLFNTPAPLRRTIKTVQYRVSLIIICKLKHRNIFEKHFAMLQQPQKNKTRNLKHNNGKHNKLVGKTDKKTQRQMNNEYQKNLFNTPAPQREKTKTADGTKNARRSVGQNAWFASGNLRVKGGIIPLQNDRTCLSCDRKRR